MAAPPISYRFGGTDAQIRNAAGTVMPLVVPAGHFLITISPAGSMAVCPGGHECGHRVLAVIGWSVLRVPADGSMAGVVFSQTVIRVAWLNALFAAVQPEIDTTRQLSSLDGVVAYVVAVIRESTTAAVLAAREVAVADMLTLAPLPAFGAAVPARRIGAC